VEIATSRAVAGTFVGLLDFSDL